MSNPLLTRPGVMERAPGLVHLCLRNDPMVVGYQFWGQRTVNDAYGDPLNSGVLGAGPTAMFEVNRGLAFRSPALRLSGRGQIVGSIKGQTHAAFDPSDFAVPGVGASPIPPDEHWMFLRVQENRNGVGLLTMPGPLPVLGPIFCTPPAPHFGSLDPSFTLQGTAPSSTACVAGALPDLDEDLTSAAPRAMHLVFPGWVSELHVRNLSFGEASVNLLVSFGPGQAMRNVEAGGRLSLTSGEASVKEVLLACPDGVAGAAFTLHAISRTEM